MLLSYTSKLNGETYQIRLCDKQWGISQPLAESNLKVIKKIVADKPDLNQLKSIDFKLYQLIKQYKLAQEFINKYLNHTKLTKQMLCLIYLKYVWDWNNNTKQEYRKFWHSQIASCCGCCYNTPRNVKYILDSLRMEDGIKFSSYWWFDFINALFNKRKELKCKERTIYWMYKANSNEGLISGRFKNDNPKAFAEKKLQKERQQQYTLESISDDLYFKNGF